MLIWSLRSLWSLLSFKTSQSLRSLSDVHSIVSIIQETSEILFLARNQNQHEMNLNCSAPWEIWRSFWSFMIAGPCPYDVSIVTIAGIEPDPIPARIVHSNVSIWSLTDFSAIVTIVTIKWKPGFTQLSVRSVNATHWSLSLWWTSCHEQILPCDK